MSGTSIERDNVNTLLRRYDLFLMKPPTNATVCAQRRGKSGIDRTISSISEDLAASNSSFALDTVPVCKDTFRDAISGARTTKYPAGRIKVDGHAMLRTIEQIYGEASAWLKVSGTLFDWVVLSA